jgi:hypothetical protein
VDRLREIQKEIAKIGFDISTKKMNALKLACHEFYLALMTLPEAKITDIGRFYGGLYAKDFEFAKLMNKGEEPLKDDEDFINDSSDVEADGGPDGQDEDPEVSSQELDDESEDIAEDEE